MNDNEVEILKQKISNNLLLNNNRYEKIIDNQTELINRLKYENQLLNENVKKFRRSKKILSDHDYTAKLSIEPIEVLEVHGVPESGLLGYTKAEFISNAFDFVNTNMFPPKYMERVSIEFKERVELAKELGLENFDISLNVQFISKDGQSIWAYYVSFYNLNDNVVELYIKFLDDFKSFDTSVKN
jgi:hypothetical protein